MNGKDHVENWKAHRRFPLFQDIINQLKLLASNKLSEDLLTYK